jgi:hypothetical protein
MDTPDTRHVRMARFACVILVAGILLAIWAQLPYLRAEYSRLSFWKLAGLLFSDISAFIWFLRFAFVHAIMGKPLLSMPVKQGQKPFKFFAIAVVAAILIDFGFSLYLMHDEKSGYAQAQVTRAQVLSVEAHKREKSDWYELDCRFNDELGKTHLAHVRIWADQHQFPSTLPAETVQIVTKKQKGETILIRYDRDFSKRAWVDGAGGDDGNSIYWFSILTLFFQTIVTALLLLLVAGASKNGTWPWWSEIYKVFPLAVEAFWMFTMGMIDRMMDWLN